MISDISKRQKYNYKILDLLRAEIERNPQLRFGQILCNLNILQYDIDNNKNIPIIKDVFYDESVDIFNRMNLYVTLYRTKR